MGVDAEIALLHRSGDADRGVRIAQHPRLFEHPPNRHLRLMFADRMRAEQFAQLTELSLAQGERAGRALLRHQSPDTGGIPAGKLEQETLEIARKLDVHARALRWQPRLAARKSPTQMRAVNCR